MGILQFALIDTNKQLRGFDLSAVDQQRAAAQPGKAANRREKGGGPVAHPALEVFAGANKGHISTDRTRVDEGLPIDAADAHSLDSASERHV